MVSLDGIPSSQYQNWIRKKHWIPKKLTLFSILDIELEMKWTRSTNNIRVNYSSLPTFTNTVTLLRNDNAPIQCNRKCPSEINNLYPGTIPDNSWTVPDTWQTPLVGVNQAILVVFIEDHSYQEPTHFCVIIFEKGLVAMTHPLMSDVMSV